MTSPQENGPQDDLDRAIKGMRKAAPSYRQAHLYYEAEAPEVHASPRLRRAMRRNGMTLQMNFSKTVVDSVVDRLEVASITATNANSKSIDSVIERAMKANKFQLQHLNWIRKACTYGDAYVLVWPKDDANPRYVYGDVSQQGAGAPTFKSVYDPEDLRLIYQDPQCVRVFYNRDDPLVIDFVSKRWIDDNERTRIDLYYADRIECYISKKDKKKEFQEFSALEYWSPEDHERTQYKENTMPNPFGVIPFFHFRTDADDYGQPEHKHFYPVHDAIHKLALGHISGVDYQAFPQRYALMNPDADTSEAARLDEGYFSVAQNGERGTTEDMQGEGVAQFNSDPGSVWMANDVKGFGQFDVAKAENFTAPMEFYLRCGATITNTPLHYFDPSGTIPSGEALRTEEAPFVKKVRNRQLSFGDTLVGLFEFILKLCGNEDEQVAVRWVPAETWDDTAAWEVTSAKQAAGVPVEQTLQEMGYTAAQIEEWQGTGQVDLPQRVQLFYQLGQGLAAFGTAVANDIIKPDQIAEILGNLLGDLSAGAGESERVEPPTNPVPDPPPEPQMVAQQPLNQQAMSNEPGQQPQQRTLNNQPTPPGPRPQPAPGKPAGGK